MQSPETEIEAVIKSILSKDINLVNDSISKYFTDDFTLQHPIFKLSGKIEISKFYSAWSVFNGSFKDISVNEIMINTTKTRIVIDLQYSYAPVIFLKEIHRMRIVVLFHLVKSNERFLISRQEDYYPTGKIPNAIIPFQSFRMVVHAVVEYLLWLNGMIIAYVIVPIILWISGKDS
jgi:hypothetical protein